jgi:hypothetical protein
LNLKFIDFAGLLQKTICKLNPLLACAKTKIISLRVFEQSPAALASANKQIETKIKIFVYASCASLSIKKQN